MFSEKIQHFEFVDFPFLIMVLYCNFIKIDFFFKKNNDDDVICRHLDNNGKLLTAADADNAQCTLQMNGKGACIYSAGSTMRIKTFLATSTS